MTEYRIGYFGLDHSHRSQYLESLAELPTSIDAVYAPNGPSEIDSMPGLNSIRLYQDHENLFSHEEIDIAWVTLPNRDTPDIVGTAIDHDVGVFSEKPMARNASELRTIARQATSENVNVGVGYFWRYHPMSKKLRELLAQGVLGSVKAVNARWFATTVDSRLSGTPGDYIYDLDASGGGILQWLGCHWIDLVPWLLRDPIKRVNTNLNRDHPARKIETNATIEFETVGGILGTLQAGYLLQNGYDTEINIYGNQGMTRSHQRGPTSPDEKSNLFVDARDTDIVPQSHHTYEYQEPTGSGYMDKLGLSYLKSFLEVDDIDDDPTLASIEDALRVLEVLDAIYESAEKEAWTAVGQ